MDFITNIDKYKQVFSRLSKNPENMFQNYLKEKNLSELDFLYQIGLNHNLINEHNFEEINAKVIEYLPKIEFPTITASANKEENVLSDITLNRNDNKEIVISSNALKFYTCRDTDNIIILDYNYYILVNDIIKKVDFEISLYKSELSENFNKIDEIGIKMSEMEFYKDGEVKIFRNFNATIGGVIKRPLFENIMRYATSESIEPLFTYIGESIKEGIIKKEDLTIESNNMLKK